jgi:hypothetical protein
MAGIDSHFPGAVAVVVSCSDETHLHWFHASTMELDTEFELIGILVGEQVVGPGA